MKLERPGQQHLSSYLAALERGWSPDNTRPEAAREEVLLIGEDAVGFLARLDDREATGPAIKLADGSTVNRLPGFYRWMWDGEFCGSIGFRWQKGTNELPPHCLGHIGYSVVPWKRGLGYAKAALQKLLPEAKSVGLTYVEITTDVENDISQRVIRANGGVLIERFIKPPQHGGKPGLRFRIDFV